MYTKNVEQLREEDWAQFPVWEFIDEHERVDDLLMCPVSGLPVIDMTGRLVRARLRLANDAVVLGVLGNLDLLNYEFTKHFLLLTVYQNQQRFVMARYHDVDWNDNGPEALATFLGLSLSEVFPISYDVSDLCVGDPLVTCGVIQAEPAERLAKIDLRKLALK